MGKFTQIMNGKKTITGIILLIVSLTSIAGYVTSEEMTAIVDAIFVIAGGIMTIVGIIHKIIKAHESTENF